MTRTSPRIAIAILMGWAVLGSAPAAAQSGPLTDTLREQEPLDYAFRLGSFLFSPTVSITELGIDSNVFDEPENPKQDFTVAMRPDLVIYANLGLLRFTGSAASEFTYFHDYKSERSVARQYRGRLEGNFSLMRPFVAAAINHTHTRPNDEIDLRAQRDETEMTVGVAAAVSPIARIFVMGSRLGTEYDDHEVFRDVGLASSLNREEDVLSAGLRLQATPFTTVTFSGGYSEEHFDVASGRDATTRGAKIDVEFSPDAVLRGKASLAFEDFRPEDPDEPTFRGLVGQVGLSYSLFERATFGVDFNRLVQYSYEEAESHFVDTALGATWTHRLVGPWDTQVRYMRHWLDYALNTIDPYVDEYQVGVGYNLRDTSRIGVNLEYAERFADERPDRRYDRRRVFASYTYGFRQ